MEELQLTDPVVTQTTKSKFRIVTLTMQIEGIPGAPPPGQSITIGLKDNNDAAYGHSYTGQDAADFIKFINTGNFTTKSLNKRILEKLSSDGILPGTVVGAPE